jgi:hypothetical protein
MERENNQKMVTAIAASGQNGKKAKQPWSDDRRRDLIEMHNWAPVGYPARFAWVHKNELEVDTSYQRSVNVLKATDIAREFDWELFSVLIISFRNGKYFVTDGQHRLTAAKKRPEIELVPCLVFESTGPKDEAVVYIGANTRKSQIRGYDLFKAKVVSLDSVALGVTELLSANGRKPGPSPSSKTVACLQLMCSLYTRNADDLKTMFPLICDLCASASIPDSLVRALMGTQAKARAAGHDLTQSPFRERLLNASGEVLSAEINREKQIVGEGGCRTETRAIIKWLNKQRGVPKLQLPE